MKTTLKKITVFLLFLISLGMIGYVIYTFLGGKIPALQSKEAVQATETVPTGFEKAQLISKIQPYLDAAIEANKEKVLAYLLYSIEVDHVDLNEAKTTALVWLAMRDPASGQLLPSEPGLAIAMLDGDGIWQITLQADENWTEKLSEIPLDMLSQERRIQYLSENEQAMPHDATVYTGYKLPWKGGEGKYLTGSIGHVFIYRSCVSDCLYAFDFADGTMFPVLAAKAGTVKYAAWGYENGNTENANYIVLEDTTTTPVTYQVYLHLAKDSIPEALRTAGTPVQQGDQIGIADDTGYSTGHHLHFHVHTNANSYWGTSVDISFDEVAINGGRPRTCNEAEYYPDFGTQCQAGNLFISQNNNDHTDPTGAITTPAAYAELTESEVPIHIELSDPSGIKVAELWLSQFDTWEKYSDLPATTGIDTTLDLCSAGLKSGPFSASLIVEDNAGNRTENPIAITQWVNKSTCTMPASVCAPTTQQIALFSEVQFAGECIILENGLYNDLASMLPADWPGTQSMMVGENAQAVLFSGSYASGRMESLLASDPIGENNRVPFSSIQSIKVQTAGEISEPILQTPQLNDQALTLLDSLTLTWAGAEGANTYTHSISGPNAYSKTEAHSASPYLSIGSLPGGEYLWTMQAEQNGVSGPTASLAFEVGNAALPAQQIRQAPYLEEWPALNANDWFSSGDWQLSNLQIGDWAGSAWVFGNGTAYHGSGDLTSPPITIPESGYGIVFSSFSDIENTQGDYDRREVQISVNGSNFIPLYTLAQESVQRVWNNSPVLDLSAYAGQNVRLRFHFESIDALDNQHLGWIVRSVRVEPFNLGCQGNNTETTAIQIGQLVNDSLCSAADTHTYLLNLEENQALKLHFTAQENTGHPFIINILDPAGNPLMNSQESTFSFRAFNAGLYQIVLTNTRYPDGLSGTLPYQLQSTSDNIQPAISFQTPVNGVIPQGASYTVTASATDDQGIEQVNLYWHSPDWVSDAWQLIGSDFDASDGWSITFLPEDIHPISGSALWLEAIDSAGNSANAVMWKLHSDQSPPETRLLSLPEYTESTLIPLAWDTSFGADKVAGYELIYRVNGGTWQTLSENLPAETNHYAFIGNGGDTLDFNLRTRDINGNVEPWQDEKIVSTSIAASCTRDEFDTSASGDDTWQSATLSTLDATELHNFCEKGDSDWYALSAGNGKNQTMLLTPQDSINGLMVTIYDAQTLDVLRQENSYASNDALTIEWTFEGPGDVVVQVEPADGNVWGSNTHYEWLVKKPLTVFPLGLICGGTGLPALLLLVKLKKKKEK